LVPSSAAPESQEEETLSIRASPILREALSSVGPGEDFDEALLRTLKARYPEHAAALLSAHSQVIAFEAERAGLSRQQAIRQLAESEPGPEITFKVSRHVTTQAVADSEVVTVADERYASLAEVPAHLRPAVEQALRSQEAKSRRGCLWALIGGWLGGFVRWPKK
jgi:hypothetical protein